MSTYISSFSPWISDFFAFRRALGYSDQTYGKNMKNFFIPFHDFSKEKYGARRKGVGKIYGKGTA